MKTIKVKVKPNSNLQGIEPKGDYLLVNVKNKPQNNKANLELLQLIAKHFSLKKEKISIKIILLNWKKK